MSGQAIVMAILKASAEVGAQVSQAAMYPGEIPLGAQLPAIGVLQISGNERNTVSNREAKVHRRERIQVTVAAASYSDKKRIFGIVRRAVRYQRGTIAGFTKVSVLPDADGPDFELSDPSIKLQSKDFLVSYNEPL